MKTRLDNMPNEFDDIQRNLKKDFYRETEIKMYKISDSMLEQFEYLTKVMKNRALYEIGFIDKVYNPKKHK